nr:chromatin accessibility complex protein 1 isoform X3 [Microcebus murinus]
MMTPLSSRLGDRTRPCLKTKTKNPCRLPSHTKGRIPPAAAPHPYAAPHNSHRHPHTRAGRHRPGGRRAGHHGACGPPEGPLLARGRASPHYNSHGAAGRGLPAPADGSGRQLARARALAAAAGRGGKMADVVVGKDKCGEQRLVSLPLSRIRVIMKSSPEVSSINQEALVLTAKATIYYQRRF